MALKKVEYWKLNDIFLHVSTNVQASLFNATLNKKDPRVENANQGALGFPVVLAMLADQTAFNLGHDFVPSLNFSPSTLPSHQLDPC